LARSFAHPAAHFIARFAKGGMRARINTRSATYRRTCVTEADGEFLHAGAMAMNRGKRAGRAACPNVMPAQPAVCVATLLRYRKSIA
jgi:hypothetical protein